MWGESQGGQASLFTGQLASSYAPELNLLGVVASARASDLVDLFKTKIGEGTAVGNILLSMALASWARVYDDAELNQILTPVARPLVNRIAENCILNPAQILASVPAATALNVTFLSEPPWDTEPWTTILAENTPYGAGTGAPDLDHPRRGQPDCLAQRSAAIREQAVRCRQHRRLPHVPRSRPRYGRSRHGSRRHAVDLRPVRRRSGAEYM